MVVNGKPIVLGVFHAVPSEMMFIQYMPIMMPGKGLMLPPNLQCFEELIDASVNNYILTEQDSIYRKYVYLTAKHLFVTPENLGNRPGWHIDGFGTDDINYSWSNGAKENSTEFCIQEFDISEDEHQSMLDMNTQADEKNIITYPVGTLVRHDNQVVHRTSTKAVAGFRTFVRVSVSDHQYNMKGNAHNYLFDYDWNMKVRDYERNVTAK
jgi:hypothetical protein